MEYRNVETNIVFWTVAYEGKLYSDQTGRFTVTSIRGVKYVFILYSYDANGILSEPLKIRTGKNILLEYTTCNNYLKERGFNPKIHWLDNKASSALDKYNRNQGVYFQLVPPGMH